MSAKTRRARARSGGLARAAILTPEQRRETAQQAARARWHSAAFLAERLLAAGGPDLEQDVEALAALESRRPA